LGDRSAWRKPTLFEPASIPPSEIMTIILREYGQQRMSGNARFKSKKAKPQRTPGFASLHLSLNCEAGFRRLHVRALNR
jgi:hypothetical protein